jgi:hypothetical protein
LKEGPDDDERDRDQRFEHAGVTRGRSVTSTDVAAESSPTGSPTCPAWPHPTTSVNCGSLGEPQFTHTGKRGVSQ